MDDKKKNKHEEETEEQINVQSDEKAVEPEENSENQVLLQKLADAEDKYRRALADYQNLLRRTQDEKREWARLSNKELVLKLLPILDTLMLAEKHTKDQNFVLTVQQFLQALAQEGIGRIKTLGEEYNPQTMEAVTTAIGEDGKVLEEVRAGYIMGETVLRPAQVIVGKEEK